MTVVKVQHWPRANGLLGKNIVTVVNVQRGPGTVLAHMVLTFLAQGSHDHPLLILKRSNGPLDFHIGLPQRIGHIRMVVAQHLRQ